MVSTNKILYICFVLVVVLVKVIIVWLLSFGSFYPLFYAELDFFSSFKTIGGTQQEFFFAGIDGVKFRRPVVPGDQLVMKVVLTKLNKRFGIAKMKGQKSVR